MPRVAHKLTARQVASLSKPGLHSDGAGLYLRVDASGAKRWAFIFSWRGRRREMSLGPLWFITLQEARLAAHEARRHVRDGVDPIKLKRVQKPSSTFGAEAEALIEQMSKGWKSQKLASLWRSSLQMHAKSLWDRPVNEITTEDVLSVLKPIWTTKPETASKVRGRIERVLDACTARGPSNRRESRALAGTSLPSALASPEAYPRASQSAPLRPRPRLRRGTRQPRRPPRKGSHVHNPDGRPRR